jgi:hypothetical protein
MCVCVCARARVCGPIAWEKEEWCTECKKIGKPRQFITLDLKYDLLKLHELGMAMYELADEVHLSHSDVCASLKTKDKCDQELEIVCTLHVRLLF